jgi:hypothetical protein
MKIEFAVQNQLVVPCAKVIDIVNGVFQHIQINASSFVV